MSCGPAQLLKDIRGVTEQVLEIADKAATLTPYGVATTAGFIEAQTIAEINKQVALVKQFIDNPLTAIGAIAPGLQGDIQKLIAEGEAIKDTVGAVVGTVAYVASLKDKYSDVDVDIDNVLGLMDEVSNDLELLCKIVPNIADVGGELVVLGFPVSFPDIDPGTIAKEGKFPDILKNIKEALKDVEVVFIPDPDKEGITVSEEPGAPFRINGAKRDNRQRATFLDDLTGGEGFGGKGLLGEISSLLDTVEGVIQSIEQTTNNITTNT
jgi:hypothetical protein